MLSTSAISINLLIAKVIVTKIYYQYIIKDIIGSSSKYLRYLDYEKKFKADCFTSSISFFWKCLERE